MGDDVDAAAAALLASLAPSTGGAGGSKKNKKKKKKAGTTAEVTNTETKNASEPDAVNAEKSVVDDEASKLLAELGIGEEKEVASTKNKKKKKKKKADKSQPSAMALLAAQHLQKKKEEEALKNQEEEERLRLEAEELRKEEELKQKEEERKRILREKKKKKREADKKAGKAVTKAQKAREQRAKMMRDQLIAQGVIKVDDSGNVIVDNEPKKAGNNVPEKIKPITETKTVEPEKETVQAKEPVVEATPVKTADEVVLPDESQVVDPEPIEEEEKPLVSNWEDLGADDWENKFSEEVLEKANNKGAFDDEEEVVTEEFVAIEKPKKKKIKEPEKTSDGETKGTEVPAGDSETKGKGNKGRNRELRSPICVVMGHVDTGKTKMLDKIRKTNVQDNEAGGITQQIGATFFPMENLRKLTDKLNADLSFEYKVPGLLMIDTPGHESFSNLRKRGSNLCDIAILIVDLMHGLEQQTIESINLLKKGKTPFIVALNKIDRLYNWQAEKDSPFRESLAKQEDSVILEFENRSKQVITQLMQEGLNAKLYYENDDFRRTVSLVPTSAHTGEGIPDLLLLLIQLTQKMLFEKIVLKPNLECNVIEVKKIEGVGTTVDVVLVNGELNEGDEIFVATMGGPVRTQIKALLTPQPLREMRVKSNYIHHKTIKAAMGVKIVAPGLEEAIAGTQLVRYNPKTDRNRVKALEEKVMADYDTIIQSIDQSGYGVCVQASTLGSLEALIDFLRSEKIPVNCVSLGPIHKKDVMRASVMLEHKPEFATILAFDVKVTKDAQELSEELGVRIFTADIIYHLFDQFTKYMEEIIEKKKAEVSNVAVFPCILKIMAENVFMKKSPLIMGVEVVEGILKVGTPIVVPDKMVADPQNPGEKMMLSLGKIESIQKDQKDVQTVKRGSKVCVKISGSQAESYVQFGRHFDDKDLLYSKLTRESIDSLKTNFKTDLEKSDWLTVIKLKKVFSIA